MFIGHVLNVDLRYVMVYGIKKIGGKIKMNEEDYKIVKNLIETHIAQQNKEIESLKSKNNGVLNCLEEIVNSMKNFEAINNIQKILKKLRVEKKL